MAVSSAYVGGAEYFRSSQSCREMVAANAQAQLAQNAALLRANSYQNAACNQQGLGNYMNAAQSLCSPYRSAAAVKPAKPEASPSVIIAREGWCGGEAKPQRRGKNPKSLNG